MSTSNKRSGENLIQFCSNMKKVSISFLLFLFKRKEVSRYEKDQIKFPIIITLENRKTDLVRKTEKKSVLGKQTL